MQEQISHLLRSKAPNWPRSQWLVMIHAQTVGNESVALIVTSVYCNSHCHKRLRVQTFEGYPQIIKSRFDGKFLDSFIAVPED